jgi:hypothetical protein
MDDTRQQHWNAIYKSKDEWDVSWFEAFPAISLEMIEAIGLKPDTCIVDVGGGESRLIDALLGQDSIVSPCSTSRTKRSSTRAHESAQPLES